MAPKRNRKVSATQQPRQDEAMRNELTDKPQEDANEQSDSKADMLTPHPSDPPNVQPESVVDAADSGKSTNVKEGTAADNDVESRTADDQDQKKTSKGHAPTAKNKKRKNQSEDRPVSKAARRTARGASKPTQEQLLNFLLTPEARDLATPQDERDAVAAQPNLRTYSSSVFSPFEELLCAVVLSRPISHKLGLRTIRTILNDPYNFNSARLIKDAGEEQHRRALDDAKTQHRGKTATQIGEIADLVLNKFVSDKDTDGTDLQKVLDDSDNDIDQALSLLKDNIKGLGSTGLDIFLRRVQWLWIEGYPFVDGRTRISLKQLGLPQDADELRDLIDAHWAKLNTDNVTGDDEAAKKRRAFVVVLERAVGSDLEGSLQSVVEAAAGDE